MSAAWTRWISAAAWKIWVQTIVYTDISRDGMMQGPNVAMTKKISDAVSMDIIASGGVSCMEDLYEIERAGIHGAIMGKSLYEKKIDLTEAVKAFEIPQITLDLPFSSLKLGPDGLLPVVVQDNRSGEVLMVAYMNEEALPNSADRPHDVLQSQPEGSSG